MFSSDVYELLDFGNGRKLERFGAYVLDRPSPAVGGLERRRPELWSTAAARFQRIGGGAGSWACRDAVVAPWMVRFGGVTLELKLTDFGHLGIFPEQADNWAWIAEQVRQAGRPKVLNLFAYTGASSLVAAAAGAEVVHVDAAANVVGWARRNAEASGLADAPVRWIVEDVTKFVRRELKRKQTYNAVLLDPPAYGHGPSGQNWNLNEHLDGLLAMCFELCRERGQFMLFSCHTGELATAQGLLQFVRKQHCPEIGWVPRASDMELDTAAGDRLHAGAAVRWSHDA